MSLPHIFAGFWKLPGNEVSVEGRTHTYVLRNGRYELDVNPPELSPLQLGFHGFWRAFHPPVVRKTQLIQSPAHLKKGSLRCFYEQSGVFVEFLFDSSQSIGIHIAGARHVPVIREPSEEEFNVWELLGFQGVRKEANPQEVLRARRSVFWDLEKKNVCERTGGLKQKFQMNLTHILKELPSHPVELTIRMQTSAGTGEETTCVLTTNTKGDKQVEIEVPIFQLYRIRSSLETFEVIRKLCE